MSTAARWWRDERVWLWADTAGVLAAYAILAVRTSTGNTHLDDVALQRRAKSQGAAGASTAGDPDTSLVSVIVPARDEERNIAACVASLLAQDYARFEVIVVDDGSRDATPGILAELQTTHPRGDLLHVVRLDELPAGWAGKPHALHAGARAARGDWLLFTDADTEHAPHALSAAMRYARTQQLDLVSLSTYQELPGFWNKVLMPIAYMGIGAQYPLRAVNDPRSPVAIANGQFILIARAAYDSFGGYSHPRLRASVVDDRDLAREVKARGFRLRLADGRALVRTHMYRGLREHWGGWSKNVYVGSRGGPLVFAVLLVGLFNISVAPALLLAGGLTRSRRAWLLPALCQSAAILAFRWRLDRALDVPAPYGATHPLGGAAFTAILARAAWRKLTGRGVEWRGRRYSV
jgi:chlorobactene glucosyltransferase